MSRTGIDADGAVGDGLPLDAVEGLPHEFVLEGGARCDADGGGPDVTLRPLQQWSVVHVPAAHALVGADDAQALAKLC